MTDCVHKSRKWWREIEYGIDDLADDLAAIVRQKDAGLKRAIEARAPSAIVSIATPSMLAKLLKLFR